VSHVVFAVDVANMLGVTKMFASLMVNMTAVLTSSATATLLSFSFAKNLFGVVALFWVLLQIHSGFINAAACFAGFTMVV
jgi:hypothetical protein